MCVVSMVHDVFSPKIPTDWWPPHIPIGAAPQPTGFPIIIQQSSELKELKEEIAALRKTVSDFREAVEAATKVDRLTGQSDCVGPQKKTLEERVALLEKRLDAASQALG